MDEDRRIPKRVPLHDVPCRLQVKSMPLRTGLVDISPGGACVRVGRIGSPATEDIVSAWLQGLPVRVDLGPNGRSSTAMVVWARGPRPDEEQMRFGLRFSPALGDFASVIRDLTTG